MLDLSPYKLTIVGAIVVLSLSVAVLSVINGPSGSAQYVAFLIPTVTTLLVLLRAEANAKQSDDQHNETLRTLNEVKSNLAPNDKPKED
jgi:hypothetical protein